MYVCKSFRGILWGSFIGVELFFKFYGRMEGFDELGSIINFEKNISFDMSVFNWKVYMDFIVFFDFFFY